MTTSAWRVNMTQRKTLYTLNNNTYAIQHTLGVGTYSEVWLAKHQPTRAFVALKIVPTRHTHFANAELDVLRKLKQACAPHVLQCHDSFVTADKDVVMVLDYMNCGDLYHVLGGETRKPCTLPAISFDTCVRLVHHVLRGVQALHALEWVHRDIKLDNVMIQYTPKHGHVAKLGDFGFACRTNQAKGMTGSRFCLAPEMLHSPTELYGTAVDIWQLGVLVYDMTYGKSPFARSSLSLKTSNSDLMAIKRAVFDFPPQPKQAPTVFKQLIRSALIVDVNKRCRLDDMLRWIRRERERRGHGGGGGGNSHKRK